MRFARQQGCSTGGLLNEQKDASGLMYRRNRYYDPQTGRFTQEDPIGIAGGLNVYGYAAGDPVSYADPYGLRADTTFTGDQNGDVAREAWNNLRASARLAQNSGNVTEAAAGFLMESIMNDVEDSPVMFTIDFRDRPNSWENNNGGAEEGCSAQGCTVRVDSQPHGTYAGISLMVKLAHEVTGSLMRTRGVSHHSDFGAVSGENAARTMMGCERRVSHSGAVPSCPYGFVAARAKQGSTRHRFCEDDLCISSLHRLKGEEIACMPASVGL